MNKKLLVSVAMAAPVALALAGNPVMTNGEAPVGTQISAPAAIAAADEEMTLEEENQAAYDAAQESAYIYKKKLDNALKAIAEKFGEGIAASQEVQELYNKADMLLVNLGIEMEDELDSANAEGRAFAFQIPESFEQDMDSAIDEMTDMGVKIGTALQTENQAAYEASQEAGMALQKKLDDAQKELADKYGEGVATYEEVQELYVKASDMIVALGEAMDKEKEDADAEGRPYAFNISEADEADIDSAIDEMTSKGEEIGKALQAENQAAYDASQEEGSKFKVNLDAALKAISDEYGEGVAASKEVQDLYEKARDMIVALGEAMEEEFDAANDEGRPYTFMISEAAEADIESAIDEMTAMGEEVGKALRADNKAAYEASQEAGMVFQNKLDDAQKELADKYGEGVATYEEVQELYVKASDLIVALGEAMDKEYDEADAEGRPYVFMITEADEQDIDSAIEEMYAKGEEIGEALKAENEKAYEASQLAGQELKDKLDDAQKELADKYGVGVAECEEVHDLYVKADTLIVALGDAMEEEFDAANEEGRPYTFIISEAAEADIYSAIDEMTAKGEEIGEALKAHNEEAYQASQEAGKKFQEKLDETLRNIADAFGEEMADNEKVNAAYVKASDMIVALGEAMENEFDSANEEGRPYAFMITEATEQDIDAAIDNVWRTPFVIENTLAYEASQEQGMVYQTKLDDALKVIADTYGEDVADSGLVQDAYVKASDMIVALGESMEAEFDSANEECRHYTFMIPESFEQDVDEAIAEMNEVAKKAAVDEVRAEYNEEAFQAEEDVLVALNQKLIDAWSVILEDYPAYAESEAGMEAYEAINTKIMDMYEMAEAELESVAESGFYKNQIPADFAAEVEAEIEALKANAVATGVNAVAADGSTEFYTIDGRKANRAVRGMNIIRMADGKVQKVMVK